MTEMAQNLGGRPVEVTSHQEYYKGWCHMLCNYGDPAVPRALIEGLDGVTSWVNLTYHTIKFLDRANEH